MGHTELPQWFLQTLWGNASESRVWMPEPVWRGGSMCVMHVWVYGCESTFVSVCGVQRVPIGSISPQHPAFHPAPCPPLLLASLSRSGRCCLWPLDGEP